MECLHISESKGIRELYYLDFDGTHLKFIMRQGVYLEILSLIKSRYKILAARLFDMNLSDFFSCSEMVHIGEDLVSVNISITEALNHRQDGHEKALLCGSVISDIFFALGELIFDLPKYSGGRTKQLFHVNTIARKGLHGGSFDLTVSLPARTYLQSLGENIDLKKISKTMYEHYVLVNGASEYTLNSHCFRVQLRERGLLNMVTMGDCACLGTSPDKLRDDEGYYLSSHNMDTVSQQFNMLVGIASIWKMVRDGIEKDK